MADGVLLFDKPVGPTSHDLVLQARRHFRTRQIGHAGTLDPMASGLLVLLLGEATKLSSVITAAEKEYVTTVRFGMGTSSLDAQGTVTSRRELPPDFLRTAPLELALDGERARRVQVPPQVSAIKVGGRSGHERARAGEEFELAPRDVEVHTLEVLALRAEELELRLVVSKGYYVRALARDLGAALGAPAHLSALRRVRSGPFRIEEAFSRLTEAALLPLDEATLRSLPTVPVSELEAERLRAGKLLGLDRARAEPLEGLEPIAAVSGGKLVALLESIATERALERLSWDAEQALAAGFTSWFKVRRGFR